MFGWFEPRCPVDAAAKEWIEKRLHWLSDQFGRDRFVRDQVILPTSEFFPDPMDGTDASLRNLLERVCGYMNIDPARFEIDIFTNTNELFLVNSEGKYLPNGAAGLYNEQVEKTIIHIESSELLNLTGLVGTMAHELAHALLIGERRITGNEYDNELLTDLTALFHGFGIFMGNSPRNWDGQYGLWPGSKLKRPEYMTLPMFAYAMAHTAWLRGCSKPDWYAFLSFDLKPCFKQALRYLEKTGDTTFHSEVVE